MQVPGRGLSRRRLLGLLVFASAFASAVAVIAVLPRTRPPEAPSKHAATEAPAPTTAPSEPTNLVSAGAEPATSRKSVFEGLPPLGAAGLKVYLGTSMCADGSLTRFAAVEKEMDAMLEDDTLPLERRVWVSAELERTLYQPLPDLRNINKKWWYTLCRYTIAP